MTKDGKTAFVALGPANRVAVVDAADAQGDKISAGRPAGLAHGVHAGREISADHQRRLQRRLGDRRRRAEGDQDHSGRRIALGHHDRAMTSPAPIAEPHEIAARPDPAAVPALSIDGVSHSYGPRRALIDVVLQRRAGELHRAARPQRRRQEHAVLAGHAAVRHPDRPHRHLRP